MPIGPAVMKTRSISILIADAQFLVRLGLRRLIEGRSSMRIVGEVWNSEDLYEAASKYRPDIVIFDPDEPTNFSISDIAHVRAISPSTNFLVISANTDRVAIFDVLQSGGLSFLTKMCDEDEILGAVVATSKGEKFLCNKVIDIILEKHLPKEEATCAPTHLTRREEEVVRLTAGGMSAQQVAEKLFLSKHTVYTHRKNIMKKLGVHSVSEVILYAVNNGLVQQDTAMNT